jgi:predicted AAA+ superfamily ATPase
MMFDRSILTDLVKWGKGSRRRPLILRGARQTGKSTVVRLFAERYYNEHLTINLERAEDFDRFAGIYSLESLAQALAVFHQFDPARNDTLLFIDEIQHSPSLIKLLRFVKEERPDWHVIAAGSLLEPILEKEGMEFPVGRVSFLTLHPMTFGEYLHAIGQQGLVEYASALRLDAPFPEHIQNEFIKQFYTYITIGGMPEAIQIWQEEKDLQAIRDLYRNIYQGYREDLYKYSSRAQRKYLAHVLWQMPFVAGTNCSYTKIGQEQYRTREMRQAAETLEKAGLLHRLHATESTSLPITPKQKKRPKWLSVDYGFCIHHGFHSLQNIFQPRQWEESFRGRVMEQYAAQQLIATGKKAGENLFYWSKPKGKGEAEIDLCFQLDNHMVGIDIKSSDKNPARSLFSFQDAVNHAIPVQSGLAKWGWQTSHFNGKSHRFAYIPIYLLEWIDRYMSH